MRSLVIWIVTGYALGETCYTEQDTDYHDFQGLGHNPATDVGDCCDQCSKFPGCKFFTFAADGMCWFKDSNKGRRTIKGAIAGGIGPKPTTPTTTAAPPTPPPVAPSPQPEPVAPTKPVQVFIGMGQSNMLGEGKIMGWKDGTLEYAVTQKNLYPYLLDKDGEWAVRSDVRNVFVMGNGNSSFEKSPIKHNEWMSAGAGGTSTIGPELGIGNYLGNSTGGPVMWLKSCIGDRALGWDLLPPGSPQFEYTDSSNKTWIYAGYHDSPNRWEKGTGPKQIGWMAGEQYDGDVNHSQIILENLATYYPGATKYEVAGFFWWQGDKDSRDAALSERYEYNLVNLIKSLRKDFNAPNAKFVTASLGQTMMNSTGNDGKILDAMLAVADASKYPEFEGNVAAVYTYPLSKGGASGSHYGGNAETYMNIGEAMGTAMVNLLNGNPSNVVSV
jgi:hypothetical protein